MKKIKADKIIELFKDFKFKESKSLLLILFIFIIYNLKSYKSY